jgi:hypothetical protein
MHHCCKSLPHIQEKLIVYVLIMQFVAMMIKRRMMVRSVTAAATTTICRVRRGVETLFGVKFNQFYFR